MPIHALRFIIYNLIWGSKGFDRGLAAGEAIRSKTSNCKTKNKRWR